SQQSYADGRSQTERGNAYDALGYLLEQEDRVSSQKNAERQAVIDEEKRIQDTDKIYLENLWKAAEQTGRLPNELADMYGIPRGTSTLEAERVGISRMNANTSAYNASTSRMNAGTSAGNLSLSQNN